MRGSLAGGCLIAVLVAACTGGTAGPSDPPSEQRISELLDARDYFALRDLLAGSPVSDSPLVLLARAKVQSAFNQPDRSNFTIRDALARRPSDSLRFELLKLRVTNYTRLHDYDAGQEAVVQALQVQSAADSAEAADVKNHSLMFASLHDIPPQTVIRRAAVTIRLDNGHLPVTINDSVRSYTFDSGANLSVMMHSEAESLGLLIRPSKIEVGTSTDIEVNADVGVADRLDIGGIELRNVIFLVLADSLLTFPDGFQIRGLIGLPVIEALGEVSIRGNVLQIPAEPPPRTEGNLALEGLMPITTVKWRGETFICNLDSGAHTTQFYYPFFKRFRRQVMAAGRPDSARYAGAGGGQTYEGYRLETMELSVGDAVVTLDSAFVNARPSPDPDKRDFPACNLGQDVLTANGGYTLNFTDMALLLR